MRYFFIITVDCHIRSQAGARDEAEGGSRRIGITALALIDKLKPTALPALQADWRAW